MDFFAGMVYNRCNDLPRSGGTEKSMDKHRTNIFISLVLVLLIIAAISAWATGSSIKRNAHRDAHSAADSGTDRDPGAGDARADD